MGKAEKQTTEQSALAAGAAGIRELRTVLARVAVERERISALAAAAREHDDVIERLRRERADLLAVALVDGGGEPDLHELNERIAQAKREAAKALSEGTVANDALRVLDARRTALEARLAQAVETQLEAARNDLLARHEKALAAFNTAANALAAPLEAMNTIESVLAEVNRRLGNREHGAPGLSFYLRRALKDEGLVVIREDTRGTWTPQWLSLPQPATGAREFRENYVHDACLD